jgi:hypothetical protein
MKTWLLNPFERLAGWSALFYGLVIIFVTALIACCGNIHLDGVVDLHVTEQVSLGSCLLEGLIDWGCMAAFIYLAGLLFSRSSIRVIDVLGTQALARFPFLVSTLVSWLCFNSNILHYMEYTFLHRGEPVSITAMDVFLFGCVMLVTLVMTIWTIYLMYKAYSVSCNVKGAKGIGSFTAALIFAEIGSKWLISLI